MHVAAETAALPVLRVSLATRLAAAFAVHTEIYTAGLAQVHCTPCRYRLLAAVHLLLVHMGPGPLLLCFLLLNHLLPICPPFLRPLSIRRLLMRLLPGCLALSRLLRRRLWHCIAVT